ncbi:MAG: FtsX-like permease family protein [Nocardioidaceae bacterium]
MISASLRKSVTDLTHRRARTFFAVTTLALAVASISFFAIPTLIDDQMQEEVRATRLADVTLTMRPLSLTAEQLGELKALPNVAEVEARNSVDIRMLVGERRVPARIFGVRDFSDQSVDLVRLESGAFPADGEVLVDVQDPNVGLYDGRAGDQITIVGPAGGSTTGQGEASLAVSGQARNLPGGEDVQDENVIVLYGTSITVSTLSGDSGYNRLSFLLDDPRPAAAAETVGSIRGYLKGQPGFSGLANLPEVRAPGDWPGKEDTEQFAQLLSVITVLALLSALVLISNTMTTLVAEQTGEIGVMRAIGARRRQVAMVYVNTALLLGVLGAVVGSLLGMAIAYVLASYFGTTFWAVDVGFGVDVPVLVVSLLVGVLAPPVAALPAIRRGLGTDLRDALESTGSVVGGRDVSDRWLRRVHFLPRTMQIGLRGVGRRKQRSLATGMIVALAVGNLLAVMALADSVSDLTTAEWDDHLEDVRVWTTGRDTFDQRAEHAIRTTPGVAEVQPALVNDVTLGGEDAVVWGVPHDPLIRYRMSEGRWFSLAEEREREPVAVIERSLARVAGVAVGDDVEVSTAAGSVQVQIVGIADNQQESGTVLFVPLTTLREVLGVPSGASTYWVKASSSDHAFVDRTTTLLEDRLASLGYEVGNEITYVGARENVAANRTVTSSIAVLGFLVVAMSMVGLANAITTNVLERTREIGILRCIGARARDVRRIFATEGVALALLGWLIGIPVGFLLNRFLVWMVKEVVNVDVPATFPPWNVLIALAGTVALALVVLLLPLRRAVRFRPGDALRYT